MTDAEIAWVAGIVEGEGSLQSRQKVAVVVEMTDPDIIERLHALTGIGRVNHNQWKAKDHYKATSAWAVRRASHVVHIVLAIYPWLGNRRREAANAVLARLGHSADAAPSVGVEPTTSRLTAGRSAC